MLRQGLHVKGKQKGRHGAVLPSPPPDVEWAGGDIINPYCRCRVGIAAEDPAAKFVANPKLLHSKVQIGQWTLSNVFSSSIANSRVSLQDLPILSNKCKIILVLSLQLRLHIKPDWFGEMRPGM